MNIAFLGLGKMGGGMASRVATAKEHKLTVWNRTTDKARAFQNVAHDPAEAVRSADVVMTSLFDDKSIEELFHGGSTVLQAMRPRAIHVCLTTISPAFGNVLQTLHEAHGTRYVSGPVLGRPDVAAAGKLTQFMAGDASAMSEVKTVCGTFAEKVIELAGPAGTANSQKLCANFFIVSLIETMSECYTLGDKLGASREVLAAFFEQALAMPGLKGYARLTLTQDADSKDGFTLTGGRKDVKLMLEAAKSAQCPLEMADLIASKMDAAIAQGLSNRDWTAVQEISRQRAGLSGPIPERLKTAVQG